MGFLATAGAEVTEHVELPFPAEAYGIGALVALLTLLAVTFSFKSVAKRQRHHQ